MARVEQKKKGGGGGSHIDSVRHHFLHQIHAHPSATYTALVHFKRRLATDSCTHNDGGKP